jgi:hypothetical protein
MGYMTPNDLLARRQEEIMQSATRSWRLRGSDGWFVASNPLDVQVA